MIDVQRLAKKSKRLRSRIAKATPGVESSYHRYQKAFEAASTGKEELTSAYDFAKKFGTDAITFFEEEQKDIKTGYGKDVTKLKKEYFGEDYDPSDVTTIGGKLSSIYKKYYGDDGIFKEIHKKYYGEEGLIPKLATKYISANKEKWEKALKTKKEEYFGIPDEPTDIDDPTVHEGGKFEEYHSQFYGEGGKLGPIVNYGPGDKKKKIDFTKGTIWQKYGAEDDLGTEEDETGLIGKLTKSYDEIIKGVEAEYFGEDYAEIKEKGEKGIIAKDEEGNPLEYGGKYGDIKKEYSSQVETAQTRFTETGTANRLIDISKRTISKMTGVPFEKIPESERLGIEEDIKKQLAVTDISAYGALGKTLAENYRLGYKAKGGGRRLSKSRKEWAGAFNAYTALSQGKYANESMLKAIGGVMDTRDYLGTTGKQKGRIIRKVLGKELTANILGQNFNYWNPLYETLEDVTHKYIGRAEKAAKSKYTEFEQEESDIGFLTGKMKDWQGKEIDIKDHYKWKHVGEKQVETPDPSNTKNLPEGVNPYDIFHEDITELKGQDLPFDDPDTYVEGTGGTGIIAVGDHTFAPGTDELTPTMPGQVLNFPDAPPEKDKEISKQKKPSAFKFVDGRWVVSTDSVGENVYTIPVYDKPIPSGLIPIEQPPSEKVVSDEYDEYGRLKSDKGTADEWTKEQSDQFEPPPPEKFIVKEPGDAVPEGYKFDEKTGSYIRDDKQWEKVMQKKDYLGRSEGWTERSEAISTATGAFSESLVTGNKDFTRDVLEEYGIYKGKESDLIKTYTGELKDIIGISDDPETKDVDETKKGTYELGFDALKEEFISDQDVIKEKYKASIPDITKQYKTEESAYITDYKSELGLPEEGSEEEATGEYKNYLDEFKTTQEDYGFDLETLTGGATTSLAGIETTPDYMAKKGKYVTAKESLERETKEYYGEDYDPETGEGIIGGALGELTASTERFTSAKDALGEITSEYATLQSRISKYRRLGLWAPLMKSKKYRKPKLGAGSFI